MTEVLKDAKEAASLTFADVIRATAKNFPDPRFHLQRVRAGALSERYVIKNLNDYGISGNSDGIGTKPELAERIADAEGNLTGFCDAAFDLIAMVADDAAREGHFVLAIHNNLNVNSAGDPEFIHALATGMQEACDAGRFALLSGETAELGYRTAGYGSRRVDWNASAVVLVNEEKMFRPENLRPGQPIVALRERSIRSNGLTRARAILEHAFVQTMGFATKREYIIDEIRQNIGDAVDPENIDRILSMTPLGESLWEQLQLPWHLPYAEVTQSLQRPSTIYTPLIYASQGGMDGPVNVPIVAAAHISGGGVPLKAKRMVEAAGMGVRIEPVFPDPDGVPELIDLAQRFPHPTKGPLVSERSACEQWNRGVGFLCVTEHHDRAGDLVKLAGRMGYEATICGEIIPERRIEWRGETWDC